MGQCKDVPGTAIQTVALVFELAEGELGRSPERVAEVLRSSQVQKAIEKALLAEANKFLAAQRKGEVIGALDAASSIGSAVGKGAGKAAQAQVTQKIKASSDFQAVQASLKSLKCAWQKSPTGVWVDDNKWWLIVVASGIAVGGATAMYVAKAGDVPADWTTSLAKSQLKGIKLGKVTLGISPTFVPSKQELGAGFTLSSKDMRGVKSEFKLDVATAGDQVKTLSASQTVKVPLSRATSTTAKAGAGLDGYQLMIGLNHRQGGLTVDFSAFVSEKAGAHSYGGAGSATYRTKIDTMELGITGKGKVDRTRAAGASQYETGYEVSLGAAIYF